MTINTREHSGYSQEEMQKAQKRRVEYLKEGDLGNYRELCLKIGLDPVEDLQNHGEILANLIHRGILEESDLEVQAAD